MKRTETETPTCVFDDCKVDRKLLQLRTLTIKFDDTPQGMEVIEYFVCTKHRDSV